MAQLTRWWTTSAYHQYEVACGETPGTRWATVQSATWSTQVLDLSVSRDHLWRGLRKSYRAVIRKHPDWRVEEYPSYQAMRCARSLHRLAAGRYTRPIESWNCQAEWIRMQRARCWCLEDHGNPIGFHYAVVDPPTAYYFSAAGLAPDTGHVLTWHAILALKAIGVRWYELGWQGEAQDDKGRQIEFFRRGFGGDAVRLRDIYLADPSLADAWAGDARWEPHTQ